MSENNYIIVDGELYHYGVPGMKWGERKANRYQKKIDKINKREDKYANSILKKRNKVRNKISQKYDKKIAKAEKKGDQNLVNVRKQNKKTKIKDYDDGTKYVSKALKIGKENKTKILELKKKSINDPSIKESKEYTKAKQWVSAQRLSEAYYGKSYTTLMEAHYVAINNGKSWTRNSLK